MPKDKLKVPITPSPWGILTSQELDLVNKLVDNIEVRTRLDPAKTIGMAFIEEVGEILTANGRGEKK